MSPSRFSPAAAVPRRPVEKRTRVLLALGLVVAAALLPFALSTFRVFQCTMVLCYVLSLLGLNLISGYAGQISLGHGALFAIGAYVVAVAQFHFGLDLWAAVPLSGLFCFAFGWLFAWPIMRLQGIYLALATFSLALSIPQFLKVTALQPWTGGVSGIVVRQPAVPVGLDVPQIVYLYVVVLAVTALAFVLVWNIVRGDAGRTLRAIRDNPLAASTMGIDVAGQKRLAFAASALLTGIGGGLSAVAVRFVGPDSFGVFLSISLLVGAVVGGLGRLFGPLLGGIFIFFVPSLTESLAEGAAQLVYGIILIVCMYVLPGGIASLLSLSPPWRRR